MDKDPAFLMYSKDWLQGTSQMSPEEKGVYIDLLCHQHQDGDIPSDTKRLARMTGLSESEFLPIWVGVKSKFKSVPDNRLVNRKLTSITTERSTKGLKNTITGNFASLIRLSGLSDQIKSELKKSFKIDDFLTVPKEDVRDRLTDWLDSRLKSIANGNGNNYGREEGVQGETSTWNFKPGEKEMGILLPEIKAGAATELYYHTNHKTLTPAQIESLWCIFKKQNFTGDKPYHTIQDTYSHFINWSKTQKINGTDKSNNVNGKNAGAYELLDIVKSDFGVNAGGKKNSGA